MASKVCVVLPKGLQPLLMATGLIRTLAHECTVLVCTEVEHATLLPKLFQGTSITFWFDEKHPEVRASARGYDIKRVVGEPLPMYTRAGLTTAHMYSGWTVQRDKAKETKLLNAVVDTHGPSFVLVWPGSKGPLRSHVLPQGIPVVDASALDSTDPLDLCALLEHALQVHAPDGWFLTLADLVGGNARKFCHVYASDASVSVARRKYRRRVCMIL